MTQPSTAELLDLLAAIDDAIDIPLPALTDDEERHAALLRRRTVLVRAAIAGTGHTASGAAAQLRTRVSEDPLTYTPWRPADTAALPPTPPACAACRRRFDPADTRFDGHARHDNTPWCRSCIDLCHNTESAFHVCPICDPHRYGQDTSR